MQITDNKIKVLHVVGRMDRGGTEALVMSLLHTVDTSRFQFDLVEQTQDHCDYDDEILSLGSKIYRCPQISPTSLGSYRSWWRNFFREHPEYRIVHGHSRGSAPIYLDEAKKAGRITILHCHNNSHGRGLRGLARYIWQLPLRKIADYNFACSQDSGISQFGKTREFTVIKNGILTEKYLWSPETRQRIRSEFGFTDHFVVGNVARFVDQKNHRFLIRIFYELQKLEPGARLMLVGKGPLEEKVLQQARDLGIADKVIFTGIRSDVHELMQAMDAFVLPSLFEGLGIVNVEAQAAGLPCFASDKVVPPEVDLTELMHHIPLDAEPGVWAEEILRGRIGPEQRRDTRQDIAAAGFDIQSTCDWLCRFYEGALDHHA